MCRNTRLIVILVVLIAILLTGLLGVVLDNGRILGNLIFGDTPTKIKDGFSEELKEKLSQRYGLYIPDQAQFIDGCYTNGFRDAYIVITFEIAISELAYEAERLIGDQERQDESVGQAIRSMLLAGKNWGHDLSVGAYELRIVEDLNLLNSDVVYTKKLACPAAPFTSLFYNISNAGTVQFCFVGWRPLR